MFKKRIRASNFNEAEEDILIRCILRHATIIENKKTDACTLKEKQRAWDKIENEFNSSCPNVVRQSKALKDKYTNIKTALRKQFAVEKARRKATGGGKELPDWRPRSEAMAELANLILGTTTTFDDDDYDESRESTSTDVEKPLDSINQELVGSLHNDDGDNLDDSKILENLAIVDTSMPLTLSEPSTSSSWSKYTPTMLRKPKASQLKRPISAAASLQRNKDDSLQGLKKKLIERELEMREIEHQERLSQQRTEHKARMTLLEAQTIDLKTKIELRNLKIAKFRKDQHFETEAESE